MLYYGKFLNYIWSSSSECDQNKRCSFNEVLIHDSEVLISTLCPERKDDLCSNVVTYMRTCIGICATFVLWLHASMTWSAKSVYACSRFFSTNNAIWRSVKNHETPLRISALKYGCLLCSGCWHTRIGISWQVEPILLLLIQKYPDPLQALKEGILEKM